MSKFVRSAMKKATIYTDGACSRNGQNMARAGYGVYWPNKPENNISRPLEGRQTNQRAELKAATEGIKQAKSLGYDEVTVKTDSHYVKKGAESWVETWEKNNWSKPVVNAEDFMNLKESMEGINVKFEYIKRDENSADELARNGCKQ